VLEGNEERVRFLINGGHNVNERNEQGLRPLHGAMFIDSSWLVNNDKI
jgi:ankyrin repeat protein